MKAFEFAAPRTEADVLGLLSSQPGECELLAGGTDLVGLMRKMIVTPNRLVSLGEVEGLKSIESDSQGVSIGAAVTLDEMLESPALQAYPGIRQAIRGINSQQLQAQGTLGGEICQRPRCWFFRNGQGLLAHHGHLVEQGDNRYHAILGNSGPAKFVHPSRLAPVLVALDAHVRIAGPTPDDETLMPLEFLFRVPRQDQERELALLPNQFISHVNLPPAADRQCATYEVRASEGPDYPLCAAAASLVIDGGLVRQAKIVLGQVAPTPWVSAEAAAALIGQPVNHLTARAAGEAAVRQATPLSMNRYKVHLARVSVERAILLAAGLETGGF